METARTISPDAELQTLRAQVLALAEAESASRAQLEAIKAQMLQLTQREAAARAQLKEAHGLTRALQEKAKLEAAAAEAGLKESLEAERAARAKAEASLQRASNELREQRTRPDAEMETLRALFSDLMRSEAQGRQRLERMQRQIAEQERAAHELQAQLEEARQSPAPAPLPAEPMDVQELQARNEDLLRELGVERGRAKAHAERAAAEVEWAQDRARSATQAEEHAKDEVLAAHHELDSAKLRVSALEQEIASGRDERDRTSGQQAGQLASLRQEIEAERALARTELERRSEAIQAVRAELSRREAELEASHAHSVQTLRAELSRREGELQASRAEAIQLGQKIREQMELAALRRDELADERRAAQKMVVRASELERLLGEARAQAQAADERIEALDAPGMEQKLAAARSELARMESERASEAMRRQAAEDERDRLASEHHALRAQATVDRGQAEEDVAALGAEVKRAQAVAEDARRSQAQAREELEEARRGTMKAESERAAAIADRDQAEAQMAALAAEAKRAQAGAEEARRKAREEIEAARRETKSLEDERATAMTGRGQAEAEVATLTGDLLQAQAAAEEARLGQAQAREDLEEARREAKRIEAERDAVIQSGGKSAELSAEVERGRVRMAAVAEKVRESLQGELEKLRADLVQSRADRDELARQIVDARDMVGSGDIELETLKRELDTTRSGLAAARAEMLELTLRSDASEKRAVELESMAASMTPRRAAFLAVQEGRIALAEKLLQQEILQAPDDAALHLELGRLHAQKGPMFAAAAEASLSRAIELDPTGHEALLALGLVQKRRGLQKAARLSFSEALRRKPDSVEAREALQLARATLVWRATVAAAALLALVALFLLRR